MSKLYENNKGDNSEKSFEHAHFSCEKTIYRKFHKTIENSHFFTSRLFRI